MAYTHARELPSCASGVNSYELAMGCELAFTLNFLPPTEGEIVPADIGRNFVSRDLLEATGIADALARIHSSTVGTLLIQAFGSPHSLRLSQLFSLTTFKQLQFARNPSPINSSSRATLPSHQLSYSELELKQNVEES